MHKIVSQLHTVDCIQAELIKISQACVNISLYGYFRIQRLKIKYISAHFSLFLLDQQNIISVWRHVLIIAVTGKT